MAILTQFSLAGGEVSPELYGHFDQQKYGTGLKTLRNAIVFKAGGAASRPGTYFISEVKDSTKTTVILPYTYPALTELGETPYLIEVGDLYMRFYQSGLPLLEASQTVTNITAANPCVFTIAAHGYTTGDDIEVTSSVTELGGRRFRIVVLDANTFSLKYLNGTAVDSTAFSLAVYSASARKVYTLTSPYAQADLPYLQYAQHDDKMIITHKNYAPRELFRATSTTFTIQIIAFGPDIAAPAGFAVSGAGWTYAVTAVNADTGEEGLASTDAGANAGAPTFTWTAVTNAKSYRLYLDKGLGYALLEDTAYLFSTTDIAAEVVDYSFAPFTSANNPFASNFPVCTALVNQRLYFGGRSNANQRLWASRLGGGYYNFNFRYDRVDYADPFTFDIVAKKPHEIKHILGMKRLIILTNKGEFSANGGQSGLVTPTDINIEQFGYNGASYVIPVTLDDTVIYVHASGSQVRDIDSANANKGSDISVFASHLLLGYEITSMALQQDPDPIVWCVRSDGTLLGMTYLKDQQILGWHRHDTLGLFKFACTVEENGTKAVYHVIERTVDGRTVKYIERMESRINSDISDVILMDSTLSYDGTNTNTAHFMRLSGGTGTWDRQNLTLASSASKFDSSDVGNQVWLTKSDGATHRFNITAYTSDTVVTVQSADGTLPAELKSVSAAISSIPESTQCKVFFSSAHGLSDGDLIYISGALGMTALNGVYFTVADSTTTDITLKNSTGTTYIDSSAYGTYLGSAAIQRAQSTWFDAVDEVSGLWHLEGKEVSVFADSGVVASPNNDAYNVVTVTDGVATLDARYSKIHVGLPYITDIEPLDAASTSAESLSNKKSLVSQVVLQLHNSRGIFVGPKAPADDDTDPLQNLVEAKVRNLEGYRESVDLFTGKLTINIRPEWNSNGRVFIRQIDPVPLKIMGMSVAGMIPLKG